MESMSATTYVALCPFHNDRHPSLYVSDDHYHCFGNMGCDRPDRQLFDLRLYDAARKLASDFHLRGQALAEAIRRKMKHKTKAQQLRENANSCAFCFERVSEAASGLGKTVRAASAGRCIGQAVWKPATGCPGQSISWTSRCKAIPMNEAK